MFLTKSDSHNNGVIDWQKVKSQTTPFAIDFAYIKVTQGVGYIDPQAINNATHAHGVEMPISYYHFASLNSNDVDNDASAEANAFHKAISTLSTPDLRLPIALDIETNDGNLNPISVLAWINAWVRQMKSLGHENVCIYSYTPFLNANLPRDQKLGSIPLWIAQYRDVPSPLLPVGWQKCFMWQYSAKGKINGINGDVDLNKTI